MNRTYRTLPKQATLPVDGSTSVGACNDPRCREDRRKEESFPPVPYDDPSWFLSPFRHNGRTGDSILWELTEETDQVRQLDTESPNGRRAVLHE
jgi:hypothetical protein